MQSRYCTREIWSCNAGIADKFLALSRFAEGLKYRKWDWDFNLFENSNYAILLSEALESTYGTVCWEYIFTTKAMAEMVIFISNLPHTATINLETWVLRGDARQSPLHKGPGTFSYL